MSVPIRIPLEMLFEIFQYLPSETEKGDFDLTALGRVAQVCKSWQEACESEKLSSPYFLLYQRQFTSEGKLPEDQVGRLFYKSTYSDLRLLNDANQRLVYASYKGFEKLLPPLLQTADVNHVLTCIEPGAQTPEITQSQVEVLRTFVFNIDGRPHTPLTAAIAGCRSKCVGILLSDSRIDCTIPNLKNRVTALSYAFALSLSYEETDEKNRQLQQIIAMLLKVNNIHVSEDFGTLVWNESRKSVKNVTALQWLPQLQEKNRELTLTPFLFPICSLRGAKELGRLLKDSSVNINAADKKGNRAIHLAAKKGQVEILTTLLAFPELEPFAKDGHEHTALALFLVQSRSASVIALFLNHPRTSLQDIWNLCGSEIDSELICAALKKKIIDPNLADQDGNSPLHLACRWGLPPLILFLLSKPELRPSQANGKEKTPWNLLCANPKFLTWELGTIERLVRAFFEHPKRGMIDLWEASSYFRDLREKKFDALSKFLSDTLLDSIFSTESTSESPGPSPKKKPRLLNSQSSQDQ